MAEAIDFSRERPGDAIVVGAGQSPGEGIGNGRATAVIFARAGAKVFAADKSGDAMTETLSRIAAFGGPVQSRDCDVTKSADVKALVDASMAAFGRIDILVNNVGGSAAG